MAQLSGDLACQTIPTESAQVQAGCRRRVRRAVPTPSQCARRRQPGTEPPDARRNRQLRPAADRNQPGDDNRWLRLLPHSRARTEPGTRGSARARRQNKARRWCLELASHSHSRLIQYTAWPADRDLPEYNRQSAISHASNPDPQSSILDPQLEQFALERPCAGCGVPAISASKRCRATRWSASRGRHDHLRDDEAGDR